MIMNQIRDRDAIRASMQEALKNNDTDGFYNAMDEMILSIEQAVRADNDAYRSEQDTRILAERGVRQLTSAERKYYNKVIEAMRSTDPKAALTNLDVVMPETVINSVFDELRTRHPLLSRINFMATNGKIKFLMNTNGEQKAVWGTLTDAITKDLASGFKEVDATLMKLSAFLPVAKSMLDLGPEWLDRYIREVLYEALANGLEAGIVDGNGQNQPVGMSREADVAKSSGGIFPQKAKIVVNEFTPSSMGKLVALLAKDPKGQSRSVGNFILIVNPQDYYEKIMPATTMLRTDGTYRTDVLPIQADIIQSSALSRGDAIFGMADRYFAAAGTDTDGKILFSDDYKFLEDQRMYLIKAYANGLPKDNDSFLFLNISGLRPLVLTVQQETAPTASTDATLSSIDGLTLSPTFAAATTTYTAATTNAADVVTAYPSDINATVQLTLGAKIIENGSAVKWTDGTNTLKVNVVAEDGTTKKTYTITVTKS
jgi:HK97 family phage major capsid protein|nr:MAG TPA: major capsid protein [Caudoviricetes sp.]